MNQGYLFIMIERVNCWNEEDIEVYAPFLAPSTHNFLSSKFKAHSHYRKVESGTGPGNKATQIILFFTCYIKSSFSVTHLEHIVYTALFFYSSDNITLKVYNYFG